jgi:hypothetical protein
MSTSTFHRQAALGAQIIAPQLGRTSNSEESGSKVVDLKRLWRRQLRRLKN